ncbi:MAG: CoA transferase, partial [Dehalococcoidia bacterium]
PMRDLPGADGQIQHFTGFGSENGVEGTTEGEIYRHFTQMDATTGNYACQAILMGLLARKRTGKGQRIDVSMLKAISSLQSGRIAEHLSSGQDPKPLGSKSQAVAPSQAFLCQDVRTLGVEATNEAEWRGLTQAIGKPELAEDPRFATNSDRVAHRDELSAILEPVFGSMPLDYWVMELGKAGVPCARPMRWDELKVHPQVTENGYLVDIETKSWGTVKTGGPPWHFEKSPARWFRTPEFGEHSDEIMREVRAELAAGKTTAAARNQ